MRLTLAFTLVTSPALANYSNHQGVTLFTEQPCIEAIAAIDKSMDAGSIPEAGRVIMKKGMAWGFVLGFDTAGGGLQGNEETTLIRLRKACAENPDTPAAELLRGFTPTDR